MPQDPLFLDDDGNPVVTPPRSTAAVPPPGAPVMLDDHGFPVRPRTPDWSEKLGLHQPKKGWEAVNQAFLREGVDAAEGVVSGAAGTLFQGGAMLDRWMGNPDTTTNNELKQRAMQKPESWGGSVGHFAEQGAEFIAPVGLAAKATKGMGLALRMGGEMAASGATAGVQSGGDPKAMLIATAAPPVFRGVGAAAGAGYNTVRNAAAGAQEGGLPGMIAYVLRGTVAPSSAEQMIMQGVKPRASRWGFDQTLGRSLNELKRWEDIAGKKIASLADLIPAIKASKVRVRGEYDALAGPHRAAGSTVDLTPMADDMVAGIPLKTRLENPAQAAAVEQTANLYRRPYTLEDAERLLKETNAQLEAHYNKYPGSRARSETADPDTAAWIAQAKQLREAIYNTLDNPGQGAAAVEIQKRYGALMELEDAAWRRYNVTARQQPVSLNEQIARTRGAMGMIRATAKAFAHPWEAAAEMLGSKVQSEVATFLKEQQTTDALVRRALAKHTGRPGAITMPPPPPMGPAGPPPGPGPLPFNAPGGGGPLPQPPPFRPPSGQAPLPPPGPGPFTPPPMGPAGPPPPGQVPLPPPGPGPFTPPPGGSSGPAPGQAPLPIGSAPGATLRTQGQPPTAMPMGRTAVEPPPPPPPSATGLELPGAGAAISDNMYQRMFDRVRAKLPVWDQPEASPLAEQVVQAAANRGLITTLDDVKRFANMPIEEAVAFFGRPAPAAPTGGVPAARPPAPAPSAPRPPTPPSTADVAFTGESEVVDGVQLFEATLLTGKQKGQTRWVRADYAPTRPPDPNFVPGPPIVARPSTPLPPTAVSVGRTAAPDAPTTRLDPRLPPDPPVVAPAGRVAPAAPREGLGPLQGTPDTIDVAQENVKMYEDVVTSLAEQRAKLASQRPGGNRDKALDDVTRQLVNARKKLQAARDDLAPFLRSGPIDDMVTHAIENGYEGDPARLRSVLNERLARIEEQEIEFATSGDNPQQFLQAIADYGGISIKKESALKGEIAWLKEFQDTKPSASRKNLKAPNVSISGQVRGVRGVFRNDGLSLDDMASSMQQDPRWAHMTIEELQRRIQHDAMAPPSPSSLTRLKKGHGDKWWEGLDPRERSGLSVDDLVEQDAVEPPPGEGADVDDFIFGDRADEGPREQRGGRSPDDTSEDVKGPRVDQGFFNFNAAPEPEAPTATTTAPPPHIVEPAETDTLGSTLTDSELRGAKQRQRNEATRRQEQAPLLEASGALPPIPTVEEFTASRRAHDAGFAERMAASAAKDTAKIEQYSQLLREAGDDPQVLIDQVRKSGANADVYVADALGQRIRELGGTYEWRPEGVHVSMPKPGEAPHPPPDFSARQVPPGVSPEAWAKMLSEGKAQPPTALKMGATEPEPPAPGGGGGGGLKAETPPQAEGPPTSGGGKRSVTKPDYGKRADGTPKGDGFFGPLKRPDGKVSTEISVGVDFGQGEMEIPTLVPTLTRQEVQTLLTLRQGQQMPKEILDKAVAHAQQRIEAGQSPFAAPGEADLDIFHRHFQREAPSVPRAAAPAPGGALRMGVTEPEAPKAAVSVGREHVEVPAGSAATEPGGSPFADRFTKIAHARTPDSPKTTGRDVTTWRGEIDGQPVTVRISPRPITGGENFMTSGNARLRGNKVGEGGYFLDAEVIEGEATPELRESLGRLIAEDDAGGLARPARVRAKGEPFRGSGVGRDVDDLVFAAENPKTDTLATGELQPRLPGAGQVRDTNVQTPEFEAPFSLSSEVVKRKPGKTGSMFDALDPEPPPAPTTAPPAAEPLVSAEKKRGDYELHDPVFTSGQVLSDVFQREDGSWAIRKFVGDKLVQDGFGGNTREEALAGAKSSFDYTVEQVANRARGGRMQRAYNQPAIEYTGKTRVQYAKGSGAGTAGTRLYETRVLEGPKKGELRWMKQPPPGTPPGGGPRKPGTRDLMSATDGPLDIENGRLVPMRPEHGPGPVEQRIIAIREELREMGDVRELRGAAEEKYDRLSQERWTLERQLEQKSKVGKEPFKYEDEGDEGFDLVPSKPERQAGYDLHDVVHREGNITTDLFQTDHDRTVGHWTLRTFEGGQLTQEGYAGDSRAEALVAAKRSFDNAVEYAKRQAIIEKRFGGRAPNKPRKSSSESFELAPSDVEAEPVDIPKDVTYFRSGVKNSPTDFDGLAAADVPIGITVHGMSKSVEERAVAYAKKGGQVFADSGAYGGDADYAYAMAAYRRLGAAIGKDAAANLHVVAPDILGNQQATETLQQKFKPEIDALIKQGVTVIWPIHKGTTPLGVMMGAAPEGVTFGIPFNKVPFSADEIGAALESFDRPNVRIHLLGMGQKNAKFADAVARIKARAPKGVWISADSNRMNAMFGKNRPASQAVAEHVEARAPERIDTEWESDTTELAGSFYSGDLHHFSPAERALLARELGVSEKMLEQAAGSQGQRSIFDRNTAADDEFDSALEELADRAGGQDHVANVLQKIASERAEAAERIAGRRSEITKGERAKPTTTFKGDRAEYVSGTPVQIHGGTFYEVRMLEGHLKGQTKWVKQAPPGSE